MHSDSGARVGQPRAQSLWRSRSTGGDTARPGSKMPFQPHGGASFFSDDEDEEVTLLDSVAKIDSALERNSPLSTASADSTISAEASSSDNQRDTGDNGNARSYTDMNQLRRENEQLRGEVADLTSALLARDLELTRLRERCQFLTTAVEQQDEVLAKIYSTTASTTAPVTPSTKALDLGGNNRDLTGKTLAQACGDGLFGFPNQLEVAKPQDKKHKQLNSVKNYSGAVAMVEPAREILEAHLDSMGFQCSRVEEVVESLTEDGLPAEVKKLSGDLVNVGLDHLLYPPRTRVNASSSSASASTCSSSGSAPTSSCSSSLFGDAPEPVSKPPLSWSSPRSSSFLKRLPSLERQDSSPSEEDFARSAGFLRRSNRKMSGRLSVSDLGLLTNDNQEEDNQRPETSPTDHGQLDKGNSDEDSESGEAESVLSSRSRSQRNLFADIDDAVKEKAKRQHRDAEANPAGEDKKEDEDGLTYGEFLQHISLPASRGVLDKIRTFVGSILGPRGDGRPPRSTDYVEYDFYGQHEFRRRCERFFRNMDDMLQNHPAWRHASEAKLTKARDGIEKYVMDKISDIALNQLKECQQWKKEDETLLRRMQLLSFVTPAMLDIKPCIRNEVVWSMAEDELRRINSFRSPGDKINCIVRCCSVIFSVLNLSRGDAGSRPGADDFLPVFIYIVLHSQIPRLYSNCEYISAYRNQADLMSKAGYCFVNLRSAIEFILVMDGSMLSISEDEFQRLYAEREKKLLPS